MTILGELAHELFQGITDASPEKRMYSSLKVLRNIRNDLIHVHGSKIISGLSNELCT
jgi:hypothetical protein